jgi:hypothetical protein
VSLSVEEAIAQITLQTRLTADDLKDFFACTDEERRILIQTYKDSNWMPRASNWDVVLKIVMACVDLAAMVTPIAGAVRAVYDVTQLVK